MNIKDFLNDNFLIFDGGLGTMLQKEGIAVGSLPEVYNITNPEIVLKVHKKYVEAGADVITSNTFQASDLKLGASGYSVEEIITAGVGLAKSAGAKYTALDIGPLGQLMPPMGTIDFDTAYKCFAKQVKAGAAAGADIIVIETFSDLLEAKAALLAAKENCSLPVFCTMTYQADGRTFVGTDPKTAAITLSALGADALGINCSLGPAQLADAVKETLNYSTVPVMLQPNAGLPKSDGDLTVYDVSAEEFAAVMREYAKLGVSVLGGCCGTTPEYISKMREAVSDIKKPHIEVKHRTAVTSGVKTVEIDGDEIAVIGERINPTGKKRLKEALRNADYGYITGEAISQTQAGADILDVNAGLPELDEVSVLSKVSAEVQAVTNLPLQIDSSDPAAIERAVRLYRGRPIINSVNGKRESMDAIFPIVKKYGACAVCLCLDEDGIPNTAEGRLKIAEKIVREAERYGIPRESLIVDCLVLTASAQQEVVLETLKAIKLVRSRLGLKTVLGVSNVSFGLPARGIMNSVFLAAALGAGLNAPIINPLSDEVMRAVRAFRVINNQDKSAKEYISSYGEISNPAAPTEKSESADLKQIIIDGQLGAAEDAVAELLKTTSAIEIIDNYFVPALNVVGERYEKGILFLPQLMRSAETVQCGFNVLKASVPSGERVTKGKIIVATVKGDIHDIGKNIAKMLLENYGFDVMDLGKDVPAEKVVSAAVEQDIKLVGLSALMTTTVRNMKDTITALKAAKPDCKVMVGGAVLNEEYVKFVGADYYSKDGQAGVNIANEVFGVK